MIVIPTLSMNPNNLKLHLNAMNLRNHYITTGRDEIKGRAGDIFKIEGDPRIWALIKVGTEGYCIDEYAETFYIEEGYLAEKHGNNLQAISSLKNYLRKTYGDQSYIKIHPHTFMILHIREEDLK